MMAGLAYPLMTVGLLLAGWSALWATRRRPANAGQIVAALLLEAGLAVQAAIAIVRIILGYQVAEPATFIAYSVGILLPLALGVYLARIERTRWGSLAVCFTAIVVAVMTLRLLELWRMGVTSA